MSCKDKKTSLKTIKNQKPRLNFITAKIDVASFKVALAELDNNIQNSSQNQSGPQNFEQQTLVEKSVFNSDVLCAGKRKIFINDSSFGPTLKSRLQGGSIASDGSNVKDTFRLTSGRYWTTDETGKNLIYLNGAKGASFSVSNWNLAKDATLKISDIETNEEFLKGIKSDVDILTNRIQKISQNSTGSVFFGTSQWILIKANSPFYVAQPSLNSPLALNAGGVSKTSLSSQTDFSKLTFNDTLWKNYILGGTANVQSVIKKRVYVPKIENLKGGFKSLSYINEPILKNDIAKISLTGNRANSFPRNAVQTTDKEIFAPAITTDTYFYDYTFDLSTPFSSKELENFTGLNRPLVSKIEPYYNFYIKDYEGSINDITEQLLPNMYVMITEMSENTNNPLFVDQLTLAGSIGLDALPFVDTSEKKVLRERRDINLRSASTQYFEVFGREYQKLKILPTARDNQRFRELKIEKLKKVKDKFSNISLPIENVSMLKKYEDKKYLFPMFFDISFDTDTTTEFAQSLKDAKISSLVMKRVSQGDYTNRGFANISFLQATEILTKEVGKTGGYKLNKRFEFEKISKRAWNITDLLKDIEDEEGYVRGTDFVKGTTNEMLVDDYSLDIGVFLGDDNTGMSQALSAEFNFFRELMKIIFVGKLRKIIKKHFRTFEEMMSGKLCYNETVFYKIDKYTTNLAGEKVGLPMQTFYLPNANEIDVLNFVDTQVKYGIKYAYEIVAYQAVIGTKYRYSKTEAKNKMGMFHVVQTPSVMLVEVPYFSFTGAVVDNPPVFPQVELVPYRAINNKVKLLFTANMGDYLLDPVTIEQGDEEKIKELRKAKGLEENEKIRYRTDDHTGVFQIFRTDEHPESYKDFTGKLIAAVNTDISKETPQEATSATFVDDILPNKKYYYTFRCVDNHGHISNPTEVFRIEMVDDSGSVYPLIEEVDFIKREIKEESKKGRRYVYIAPALVQTLLDEEKTGISEETDSVKGLKNVFLGLNDEKVWAKKFKIRITSRKTGKKVDLNVTFDTRHIRSEVE